MAVLFTFAELRAQLPGDARIVVVGPSTRPWGVNENIRSFGWSCKSSGLSTRGVCPSHSAGRIAGDMVAEDGGHVKDEGDAVIAERVASGLR